MELIPGAALSILDRLTRNVPQELQDLNQWGFKTSWGQCPWSVWNVAARVNDPATWSTWESVIVRFDVSRHRCLNFCFFSGCGVGGCDLDACRDPETGHVSDWAMNFVDRFDSYTEISPSGTGLHVFFRTTLAGKTVKQVIAGELKIGEKTPQVEIFTRNHACSVTGNVFEGRNLFR